MEHDNELDFEDNIIYRSEDESANEYEVCGSPTEEIDSNSGWQEVIRYILHFLRSSYESNLHFYYIFFFATSSEEVTTSDVPTEYWTDAAHPQLAHLPQLPHPLSTAITTVSGTVTVPSNVTITKKAPSVTKIGMYISVFCFS